VPDLTTATYFIIHVTASSPKPALVAPRDYLFGRFPRGSRNRIPPTVMHPSRRTVHAAGKRGMESERGGWW